MAEPAKTNKRRILLFISRHAERLDKTLNKNVIAHMLGGDPPITDNGIADSVNTGKDIWKYLSEEKQQYKEIFEK